MERKKFENLLTNEFEWSIIYVVAVGLLRTHECSVMKRRNLTVVAFLISDEVEDRAKKRESTELAGGVCTVKPQLGLGF